MEPMYSTKNNMDEWRQNSSFSDDVSEHCAPVQMPESKWNPGWPGCGKQIYIAAYALFFF